MPADLIVTGDADFLGCHATDVHLDLVSWFGTGEGERYQQLAGQGDRLWVLDVDHPRRILCHARVHPTTV